ncbi:hypothetical protein F4X10_00185 [Candidatus Poribacteria bacterium]|nr:hypothetical protein [Candidatus Poribacteria bacterium]
MKLDYNSSSLVILGGWNANIFSPKWLSNNFLDSNRDSNKEGEKVEISVEMSDTHSIRLSPLTISFKNRGFKLIFTDGILTFHLDECEDFSVLESSALKIFKGAINTIVTGYGANFTFTQDGNIDNVIDTIGLNQINSRNRFYELLTFERYNFGFNLDNLKINVNIEIDPTTDIFHLKFNFHFDIEDFIQFEKCISENSMHILEQKSRKIISETYGLELED